MKNKIIFLICLVSTPVLNGYYVQEVHDPEIEEVVQAAAGTQEPDRKVVSNNVEKLAQESALGAKGEEISSEAVEDLTQSAARGQPEDRKVPGEDRLQYIGTSGQQNKIPVVDAWGQY